MPLGPRADAPELGARRPAGLVDDYATVAVHDGVSTAAVQCALEALPSIGAGNVIVTGVKVTQPVPTSSPDSSITFVDDKAEQDVDTLAIGQWYAVPPQEVLGPHQRGDRRTDLEPDPGSGCAPGTVRGHEPRAIDKAIGDKLLASFVGGPAVTSASGPPGS